MELFTSLCEILGITLNEFFAGERITEENYKQKCDENLLNALENSSFSLQEKKEYYKKKWLKDCKSKSMICGLSWIVLFISLLMQGIEFDLVVSMSSLLALFFYIVLHNQMMAYVERNAFPKTSENKK